MSSVDRIERVNAQLLRLLSGIVHHEYQTNDLVTLTDVQTERDLKQAKVLVDAERNLETHVKALNDRARSLRALLMPHLDFKYIPHLVFRADTEARSIARVEQLLDEL